MTGNHRDASELYGDIHFPRRVGEEHTRPYVLTNMVASADGKTSVEGKASGLGTALDRSVMRTLRSGVDAVMVGGGTLRAEKLSLGLDANDRRPRPLAVVLTNGGDVPLESNLVRDPCQDVLVLLSEDAGRDVERDLGQLAEVRRVPTHGSGSIDPSGALGILMREYGVHVLLCEGGPTLNRSLISANLVDELFVTVAPMLIGQTIKDKEENPHGSPNEPERLRLLSAHPVGDELFLRYAMRRRMAPE